MTSEWKGKTRNCANCFSLAGCLFVSEIRRLSDFDYEAAWLLNHGRCDCWWDGKIEFECKYLTIIKNLETGEERYGCDYEGLYYCYTHSKAPEGCPYAKQYNL